MYQSHFRAKKFWRNFSWKPILPKMTADNIRNMLDRFFITLRKFTDTEKLAAEENWRTSAVFFATYQDQR